MERQDRRIYICRADADRWAALELAQHLCCAPGITCWHEADFGQERAGLEEDGQPSGTWSDELARADLIALLVSKNLFHEEECGRVLENAQKAAAGGSLVVPILLNPVLWDGAPFSSLPALPVGGRSVMSWQQRDEPWAEIARFLRQLLCIPEPDLEQIILGIWRWDGPDGTQIVLEETEGVRRFQIQARANAAPQAGLWRIEPDRRLALATDSGYRLLLRVTHVGSTEITAEDDQRKPLTWRRLATAV